MTALADQALADFAAREGISIKGAADAGAGRALHGCDRKAQPRKTSS